MINFFVYLCVKNKQLYEHRYNSNGSLNWVYFTITNPCLNSYLNSNNNRNKSSSVLQVMRIKSYDKCELAVLGTESCRKIFSKSCVEALVV